MSQATTTLSDEDTRKRFLSHILQDILREEGKIEQNTARYRVESTLVENSDDIEIDINTRHIRDFFETTLVDTEKTSGATMITGVNIFDTRPEQLPPIDTMDNDTDSGEFNGPQLSYDFSSEVESTATQSGDADDGLDKETVIELFQQLASSLEEEQAELLFESGFESLEDIANADISELKNVPTIQGDALAQSLKSEATIKSSDEGIVGEIASESIDRERTYIDSQTQQQGTNTADSWLAEEIDMPAGEPTGEHFCGLPILEPQPDHPFTDSINDLPPYYSRPVHEDEPDSEQDIELVARLLAKDNYVVNLIGHAGVGKTLLGKTIAAIRNQPSITLNMSGDVRTEDLFGMFTLTSTDEELTDDRIEEHLSGENPIPENSQIEMVWKDGALLKAIRNGWFIIIDEINGAKPKILFALHSLFERDSHIHVKDRNEVVEMHEQTRIITTMNPPTAGYDGTNRLNNAFSNRLQNIKIGWLPQPKEVELIESILAEYDRTILTNRQITQLVQLANSFRAEAEVDQFAPRLTPRDILKIADRADGGPLPLRLYVESYIEAITIGPEKDTQTYLEVVGDNIPKNS